MSASRRGRGTRSWPKYVWVLMRRASARSEDATRLGHEPFIAADEKAARATGWIADPEVRFAARVGLHQPDDRLDQDAGREVLAGAFLPFTGGLFEQAFERGALHVHIHRGPVFLVDHRKHAFQVNRVVESGRSLGKDVGEQPAASRSLRRMSA